MDAQKANLPGEDRISVVEIGGKWFGIDILKSKEVVPLPNITPVPNTDRLVIGVFNLRGDIYPVVDISTVLDLPEKKIQASDMVILLEMNSDVMGIVVDRIHGVHPVVNSQVKSAHGVVTKKMNEYVVGIIKNKQAEIILLNVEQLFASNALRKFD